MKSNLCHDIIEEISKQYVGKSEDMRAIVIALLTNGHVLIEGTPGLAKTTLANALAKSVQAKFTRIQFTADLMPSDVTGSTVYRIHKSDFQFIPGPVFTNILLADELNRAPARTQSALLECMQEKQVTVDGTSYALEDPFFVIATQNPLTEHGTYPLPYSQLDRFMIRILLEYPTENQEKEILRKNSTPQEPINAIISPEDFAQIRREIAQIHVSTPIIDYIAQIVRHTRIHPAITMGASPRAGTALLTASKGYAYEDERDYVTPDDVRNAIPYVLNHRLICNSPHPDLRQIFRELTFS